MSLQAVNLWKKLLTWYVEYRQSRKHLSLPVLDDWLSSVHGTSLHGVLAGCNTSFTYSTSVSVQIVVTSMFSSYG